MSDGLDAARALLPDVRLADPTRLAGGDRTAVHRVRAIDAEGRDSTVIVKQFFTAGESWARETAALSVLPPELGAPRLLASGADPALVVMTDAGRGDNLAEVLLGDDPERAAASLQRWAEAVAAVHVATRGLREPFRAALDERAGDLALHEARIGNDIDDAVRVLDRACGSLSVSVPAGAFDEVRELYHRLGADGAAALTPADACPDDNVAVDGGFVIVDYENAQWRHVAWDVAYLRVPWPTCWCSWRLPDDVADAAVAAYRRVAGPAFAAVADPAFDARRRGGRGRLVAHVGRAVPRQRAGQRGAAVGTVRARPHPPGDDHAPAAARRALHRAAGRGRARPPTDRRAARPVGRRAARLRARVPVNRLVSR